MFLRAFILGLLLCLVWLVWRRVKRQLKRGPPTGPRTPGVENMVACAHCGLHVPEREALLHAGRYYCSAQHQREAGE